MDLVGKELMGILSSKAFQKIISVDNLTIVQFNALCTLLIKNCIPFDVEFSNGTRRDEPELKITIFINPNTTIQYTFKGTITVSE